MCIPLSAPLIRTVSHDKQHTIHNIILPMFRMMVRDGSSANVHCT